MIVSLRGAAPVEMSFKRLAAFLKGSKADGSVHVGLGDGTAGIAPFLVLRSYLFGPAHLGQPASKT